MQFLVDQYAADQVSGINTDFVRATASPAASDANPGRWQVVFKGPFDQVAQQRLYGDRDRALAGLVNILGGGAV